jgi:hypothetical protein
MHIHDVVLHVVVNGEREPLRETTAITVYDSMDSAVYEKRIDI